MEPIFVEKCELGGAGDIVWDQVRARSPVGKLEGYASQPVISDCPRLIIPMTNQSPNTT